MRVDHAVEAGTRLQVFSHSLHATDNGHADSPHLSVVARLRNLFGLNAVGSWTEVQRSEFMGKLYASGSSCEGDRGETRSSQGRPLAPLWRSSGSHQHP